MRIHDRFYFPLNSLGRKQSADPLLEPFKEEFQRLTEMIAAGKDLSSLLSRDVLYKPYELNPNFAQLKDEKHLDLLLNEQGIHHLHLPTLERKKGTPLLISHPTVSGIIRRSYQTRIALNCL